MDPGFLPLVLHKSFNETIHLERHISACATLRSLCASCAFYSMKEHGREFP